MIGPKLMSTFFVTLCVSNVVQISNAEEVSTSPKVDSWAPVDQDPSSSTLTEVKQQSPEANTSAPSENPKLDLGTLVNQYRHLTVPPKIITPNSQDNAEIPSKNACLKRHETSSTPPPGIQQSFEAIVGIASKGATINPQSSIDQYESLLILLKVIKQNFVVTIKKLKSEIVDNSLRMILKSSALMYKNVKNINSSVTHCLSTYDNRTFSQLHKFFAYDNTPCDPLVNYAQQTLQNTIQAVEKIEEELKSCVESKSSVDKGCDSIAVSAAFLAENFHSSTEKHIKQQNELFTAMRCCMGFRVTKLMRIFTSNLISFRNCVQEVDPSFELNDIPVVEDVSECKAKFTFLNNEYYTG